MQIVVIVVVMMVMVVVITCLLSHYKLSARSFISRHSRGRRRGDGLSSVSGLPRIYVLGSSGGDTRRMRNLPAWLLPVRGGTAAVVTHTELRGAGMRWGSGWREGRRTLRWRRASAAWA